MTPAAATSSRRRRCLALAAALAAALAVVGPPAGVRTVDSDGMARTLLAGDRVLVARWAPVGRGDAAAVGLPRGGCTFLRCVGLPGEELRVVGQQVRADGRAVPAPAGAQHVHAVWFYYGFDVAGILAGIGVGPDEYRNACCGNPRAPHYLELPLTDAMARALASHPAVVGVRRRVFRSAPGSGAGLFPYAAGSRWTLDDYGPVHIPARGETVRLTLRSLPLYRRAIAECEGNELVVRDGRIYINGAAADTYTFRHDYYWMMGDSRHAAADSRFWGFVPESSIEGRAVCVLCSWDPARSAPRWRRCLRRVE